MAQANECITCKQHPFIQRRMQPGRLQSAGRLTNSQQQNFKVQEVIVELKTRGVDSQLSDTNQKSQLIAVALTYYSTRYIVAKEQFSKKKYRASSTSQYRIHPSSSKRSLKTCAEKTRPSSNDTTTAVRPSYAYHTTTTAAAVERSLFQSHQPLWGFNGSTCREKLTITASVTRITPGY